MTNDELEQRLRAWYDGEVGEDETAPSALREAVMAIPVSMPSPRRRFVRRGSFPLLAAAALLLGGGALAGGAALLRLTTLVSPGTFGDRAPVNRAVARLAAVGRADRESSPPERRSDRIHKAGPKGPDMPIRGPIVSRAACLDRRDGRSRCARAVHRRYGRPGRPGLVARRVAPSVLRQRKGVPGRSSRPRARRGRDRLRPESPRRSHAGSVTTWRSRATARRSCSSASRSTRRDRSAGPRSRRSISPPAGSRELASTLPAGGARPGWSPDGSQIVFSRYGSKDDNGPLDADPRRRLRRGCRRREPASDLAHDARRAERELVARWRPHRVPVANRRRPARRGRSLHDPSRRLRHASLDDR